MCKKDDPYYFESMMCDTCDSRENLYRHRYNDRVRCLSCVNGQLIQASKEQEATLIVKDDKGEE